VAVYSWRMNRVLTVLACATAITATAVMLGGCSDDDNGSGSSSSSLAACDSIYVEGKLVTVEEVEAGCRLGDGSILEDNSCEQVNGALLVTFEDGDTRLWGLTGKRLQAAETALDDDPDYTEAVALC
jgi:hypothetical protein